MHWNSLCMEPIENLMESDPKKIFYLWMCHDESDSHHGISVLNKISQPFVEVSLS